MLVVDCKFKICLEVFQKALGSQLSEESKRSSLPFYSFLYFLISFTTVLRTVLYLIQKRMSFVLLYLRKVCLRFLISCLCDMLPIVDRIVLL